MSKKVKIIILVVAVVAILAIAAVPTLKWYNQQEYVIVSKQFDVKISKDADLIYFDDDDTYCHAAYGVSEEEYTELLNEIEDAGYEELTSEIDLSNFEWIPSDKIVKGYGIILYGESYSRIFVTNSTNGCVELYFVKQ